MDWLQITFLALLQGITEFLPISSSAHLILPSALLGWTDQGLAFDVAVHLGSLFAVLWYFRLDVWLLAVNWLKQISGQRHDTEYSRMAWWVIAATIPAGLAGLLAEDWIEANLRSVAVIAATTLIFGVLLGWAEIRTRRQSDQIQLTFSRAIIIGLAQVLALIPGTSRSGITMTAALALGFDRTAATRFSFLLSIPLILAASLLKTVSLIADPAPTAWSDLVIGTALSGLAAYVCIRLFLGYINRIGFMPFVWYRLALGTVLVIMIYSGAVPA